MDSAHVEFGTLNYITLGLYLVATAAIGLWFTKRNKSTTDYFSAGRRIPWWVMGISISNVSSISYMSIPAKAYAENWIIFFVNLPILLLAPVVVFVLLPVFNRLTSASAYEYLEKRFGLVARIYGASAFVLFQVGRMALVIYMPALALAAVTDFNLVVCILLIGTLSAVYSALGGIEGVIWTDFAQTVFLLGAAFMSFFLVIHRLDGGFDTFVSVASDQNKFQMINWSGDHTTNALWVVLIGSMFTQLIPYISDQSIIQRYQTTTDLPAARRAMWINAILNTGNTLVFLAVGTAIYVYYQFNAERLGGLPRNDAILPFFIAREMPAGVAGIVIAGIFAAAQSAISTSLNSTSTVIVTDFLQRLGPKKPDAHWLKLAKWLTAGMGVIAVALAIVLAFTKIDSAFDIFQRVLGLTASGLGGLFLLGIANKRANLQGAMTGAIASAVLLYYLQTATRVHFYLYSLIGVLTCFLLGSLVSLFFKKPSVAATKA
ncbi:sodium:solute symporter [Oleiharenicola lentus]|uniref:sodium:solute symporter n=1 Tax=Oleiharenicola lentus TaxID=2508720 RepID=UPI003F67175F